MIDFNQYNMFEEIRNKTKKIQSYGKVAACGLALTTSLLLGGCESNDTQEENFNYTAVIITNEDALIMDFKSFRYTDGYIRITNMDGDVIILSYENTIIIYGDNTHEKAVNMAEKLVGDNGKVVYYDEQPYSLTK